MVKRHRRAIAAFLAVHDVTTAQGMDDRPAPGEPGTHQATRRQRAWLTLAAAGTVAGCGFATWWQAQRALHGNLLSDFYAVMWPMYGCYVIYLWSRLCRGATSVAGGPDPVPATQQAEGTEESDEELRAYNRYLAGKRADAQRRGR